MPTITFDHYPRYDELTKLLQAYAEEYPELITMSSIGKSYEGRDIWLITATNSATGDASAKPALWIDANIHASEVSPTVACLYLINELTTKYGQDETITRVLDTRSFYIVPRVNPDGAEWALADKPKIIRSSTRPYPYDEDPLGGMDEEDVDGDGRILMMRIEDANGAWKAHPEEPRLLVRRDPTEIGGTYYRVLPEGMIENYDGVTIDMKPRKQGLDMNRNFPAEWKQDYQQGGAGPYPGSEPETRALIEFIARNRNITGAITFHTFSGVLLRPFSFQGDDEMPAEDLWTFQHIGKKGTDITGYPNVSVFHDFKYHPKQVIYGGFDDWAYDHMGVYSWTVEIWSPQKQAGIEEYKFIEWYREHPHEDDLKMLKWSDEVLGGRGYIDWYAFDHPQLGKVELGGWDFQLAWRNPPPDFLEKEVAPFSEWLIWHLLISPELALFESSVTPLADGAYLLRAVVHNTGWLPTYVTKKALEKKVTRGVIAEITLPEGATLKTGKMREDIGQLEGRAYSGSALTVWGMGGETQDRAKVEWVVQGKHGDNVTIKLHHDRAGMVETTFTLG
ncbi:MAG: M14 family metallopeptidase [Aggregatilineales bacterium]